MVKKAPKIKTPKKKKRAVKKKANGRPRHKPTKETRALVEKTIGYGLKEENVAILVGVVVVTLRKYYRKELDRGLAVSESAVAESLFKKATGDGPAAVTAGIWFEKTRFKRQDKVTVKLELPKVENMNREQIIDQLGYEPTSEELLRATASGKTGGS